MKDVIFDFDGTLIDANVATLRAIQIALDENAVRYNPAVLAPGLLSFSREEIVAKLGLADRLDLARSVLMRAVQIRATDTKGAGAFYPGIKSLLHALKDGGRNIYIATNNFKPVIDMSLKVLDINIFNDVRTSDYNGEYLTKNSMVLDLVVTHKMAPAETAMVGDSMVDIDAGRVAGINTIAVAWGHDSDQVALKKSADFYVKNTKPLREILLSSRVL